VVELGRRACGHDDQNSRQTHRQKLNPTRHRGHERCRGMLMGKVIRIKRPVRRGTEIPNARAAKIVGEREDGIGGGHRSTLRADWDGRHPFALWDAIRSSAHCAVPWADVSPSDTPADLQTRIAPATCSFQSRRQGPSLETLVARRCTVGGEVNPMSSPRCVVPLTSPVQPRQRGWRFPR